MTDPTQPTTPSNPHPKGQVTPMGAGIAGAIAGAALGAAAAVALSDAETRKKVQKNIKILKDKAIKVMDSLEKMDEEDQVAKKVHEVKDTLEENQNQPPTEQR